MRIAATVTRPTSGQVLLDGTDAVARPEPLRRNLGYLPQDFGVYPHLNAREFLSYLAAVKGLPARVARTRIGELLELLDLAGMASGRWASISGGMLRRVGIAQALLADPQVLIVDEPTAGLDPEQRAPFRNLLADLAGDRVVLLSTHIVSDIESVASDIVIMADGRVQLRGSPQELLRHADGRVWEMTVPSDALVQLRSGTSSARWCARRPGFGSACSRRCRRPRARCRCRRTWRTPTSRSCTGRQAPSATSRSCGGERAGAGRAGHRRLQGTDAPARLPGHPGCRGRAGLSGAAPGIARCR